MNNNYHCRKIVFAMKENRTVAGIGEVLWDILPDGKKIGGAPANFAYHVSQFGLQSLVVSAIGDDALGQEIIGTFRDKGLNSLIYPILPEQYK